MNYNRIMTLYTLDQFERNHLLWFQAIANQILQSIIIIDDEEYEINDVSVHYSSDEWKSSCCHKVEPQKNNLYWYYSSSGPEVLDITFSDSKSSNSHGGILIRGINLRGSRKKISGVSKVHTLIRKKLGNDILKSINGKKIYDTKLKLKLADQHNFIPTYRLPRPNLGKVRGSLSDETYRDTLSLLRFCSRFPEIKPDEYDLELLSIISFLEGYETEAFYALKDSVGKTFKEKKKDFCKYFKNVDELELKMLIKYFKSVDE